MAMRERSQVVGATRSDYAKEETDLVSCMFRQGAEKSRRNRRLRSAVGRHVTLAKSEGNAPRGAVVVRLRALVQSDTEQCEIRSLVSDVLEGAAAGNIGEEQERGVGAQEGASYRQVKEIAHTVTDVSEGGHHADAMALSSTNSTSRCVVPGLSFHP